MKNLPLKFILVVLALTVSCESANETNPEIPQEVLDRSLEYFEGNIIEKKLEQEEEVPTWEVKIQNSDGAIIAFYWTVNGQLLLKMEGQTGPFDYDIWPGNNLINFSSAKTVAFANVKNDNIIKWKLAQEDKFIDKWVYTIEIETQKVYIDAENGDILQID